MTRPPCPGPAEFGDCFTCDRPDCDWPEKLLSRRRTAKAAEAIQYKARKDSGHCTMCGGERDTPGYFLCKKCVEEIKRKKAAAAAGEIFF